MCLGMGAQYSPPINNVVVIDIGHDIDFWGFMSETLLFCYLSLKTALSLISDCHLVNCHSSKYTGDCTVPHLRFTYSSGCAAKDRHVKCHMDK